MKSWVVNHDSLGTLKRIILILNYSFFPKTHIVKSLVINPSSTHWITDLSKHCAKFVNEALSSNMPLSCKPLVQAKMEAIELVEVSPPLNMLI